VAGVERPLYGERLQWLTGSSWPIVLKNTLAAA